MNNNAISPALRYVDENIGAAFSIEELATVCNLSLSRFEHLFLIYMGCRPNEYVNARRVENAKYLLALGGKNIAEIAQDVGYSSQARFCTVFKKYYGISPRDYRTSLNSKKTKKISKIGKESLANIGYNLNKRLAMILEINEDLFRPIAEYCNRNALDIKKKLQEMLVKEYIRNRIDQNGIVYEGVNQKILNRNNEQKLALELGIAKSLKFAKFGAIYEKNTLSDKKYIIGKYKDSKVVIIKNNGKQIEKAHDIEEMIEIECIEDNQAYAWAFSYDMEIGYFDYSDNTIIIRCNAP